MKQENKTWRKKETPQTQRKESPRTPKSSEGEILYGINPVIEAMKAGKRRIIELFVPDDKHSERIDALVKDAEVKGISVIKTSSAHIRTISGTEFHQNVVARVSPYPFADLADVLGKKGDIPPFLLILDGVEDPMNLGALSRTALGAGVDAILIPKDRAALPTPTAVKASAGALEHIPVVLITNINNTIRDLKKEGFWITGLDGDAKVAFYECDFTSALALVIGGEGKGLRDLVGKSCDNLAFIPQKGPVESLNASVAGAIAMYEVVRQRYGR
ncbi:MAG: 23S rRNA (guanosine(2251)-2'-O)-methyltransferase RlmB [Desulfobacteraceae bacterium]